MPKHPKNRKNPWQLLQKSKFLSSDGWFMSIMTKKYHQLGSSITFKFLGGGGGGGGGLKCLYR